MKLYQKQVAKKLKLKKESLVKNKVFKLKVFFIKKAKIEELFMILNKIKQDFLNADIDETTIEIQFKKEISKEILIDLINDMIENVSWVELEII